MSIVERITNSVGQLPPSKQALVLRYVDSLSNEELVGVPGSSLLRFAGTIDPVSISEMDDTIEKDCEKIDPGEW